MRRKQYEADRRRLLLELEEAKRVVSEKEFVIDALDRVWRHLSEAESPDLNKVPVVRGAAVQPMDDRPIVTHVIRRAALSMSPDVSFGVTEVEALVRKDYPRVIFNRATISGTLNRLVKEHDLHLVRPGRGSLPSVYRTAVPTEEERALFNDQEQ